MTGLANRKFLASGFAESRYADIGEDLARPLSCEPFGQFVPTAVPFFYYANAKPRAPDSSVASTAAGGHQTSAAPAPSMAWFPFKAWI